MMTQFTCRALEDVEFETAGRILPESCPSGVDAMQALLLAIHTIPSELAAYVRDPGGRFLHLGHVDTSVDTSFVSSCRTVLECTGNAFPPDAV